MLGGRTWIAIRTRPGNVIDRPGVKRRLRSRRRRPDSSTGMVSPCARDPRPRRSRRARSFGNISTPSRGSSLTGMRGSSSSRSVVTGRRLHPANAQSGHSTSAAYLLNSHVHDMRGVACCDVCRGVNARSPADIRGHVVVGQDGRSWRLTQDVLITGGPRHRLGRPLDSMPRRTGCSRRRRRGAGGDGGRHLGAGTGFGCGLQR